MSESIYIRGAIIILFALAVVALGANEVVKSVKRTGNEKIEKDQIIPILHGRLSLDQGRFTKANIKDIEDVHQSGVE